MWEGKLRKNYRDFDEFESYCSLYGIHTRLGFNTPEAIWAMNPIIQGSTDPADLKVISGVFTPVIFRMWKDGEVIALFPTIPADMGNSCLSYVHIGQHGAADYDFVIRTTQPATQKDYAPLFAELVKVGYDDLKVFSRAQFWMHKERQSSPLV